MKSWSVYFGIVWSVIGCGQWAKASTFETECLKRIESQLQAVDDPHYSSQEVFSKLLTLRNLAKEKSSYVNYSECGPSNYLTLRMEIATCRIEVTTGDSDGDCND
ncbi:MAG TPA: hypothetical protein PLU50_02225 [Pseudobdellovibrionaceae bacterium]|nr:hypothetical protein [Pseudobdellovibrionaceae bacterium]